MDILLDPTTHDLKITNRDLVLVEDIEETAQRLKILLLNIRGEWFRDVQQGIDWYNLLSRNGNKGLIDAQVKATILTDNDVISILTYNSTVSSNKLTILFSAKTKSRGTINVEVSL